MIVYRRDQLEGSLDKGERIVRLVFSSAVLFFRKRSGSKDRKRSALFFSAIEAYVCVCVCVLARALLPWG